MSPPFWTPLLPHSSHWGCQRALGLSSMCHIANSHWLSILYMIMYVFQFCSFVFPSPSLIASTSLFYVCVPTAALQMWTIFLNSTYMHSYTIFVFLFLTYFTQYSRLQVRSPHQSWLKCIPFHGWVIFLSIYIFKMQIALFQHSERSPYIIWPLTTGITCLLLTTLLMNFSQ